MEYSICFYVSVVWSSAGGCAGQGAHLVFWLICKFDGFLSLWPVARLGLPPPAYVFLLLCLPLPTSFLPFAPSCCVNFVFVLWFFAAFVFVPSLFYYGHRHTHTFIYCACASLLLTLFLALSHSLSLPGHLFIFVSCFRRCVVGAFININEFCSMKVKLKFTLCQQWVPFKGSTSNIRPGLPLGVLLTWCACMCLYVCVCVACMMKTCSNF